MQDQNSKKVVKLTVVIPRESYEHMKAKAQAADISINKFLNRAGSVVTTEEVMTPPGYIYTGGVVTQEEFIANSKNNK